ncbi:MAG: hypothetical protein AB2A00_28360 [Myxococcota bacterium]
MAIIVWVGALACSVDGFMAAAPSHPGSSQPAPACPPAFLLHRLWLTVETVRGVDVVQQTTIHHRPGTPLQVTLAGPGLETRWRVRLVGEEVRRAQAVALSAPDGHPVYVTRSRCDDGTAEYPPQCELVARFLPLQPDVAGHPSLVPGAYRLWVRLDDGTTQSADILVREPVDVRTVW